MPSTALRVRSDFHKKENHDMNPCSKIFIPLLYANNLINGEPGANKNPQGRGK
jgi:hypothetical protein